MIPLQTLCEDTLFSFRLWVLCLDSQHYNPVILIWLDDAKIIPSDLGQIALSRWNLICLLSFKNNQKLGLD